MELQVLQEMMGLPAPQAHQGMMVSLVLLAQPVLREQMVSMELLDLQAMTALQDLLVREAERLAPQGQRDLPG
jgi:hypothetical protein